MLRHVGYLCSYFYLLRIMQYVCFIIYLHPLSTQKKLFASCIIRYVIQIKVKYMSIQNLPQSANQSVSNITTLNMLFSCKHCLHSIYIIYACHISKLELNNVIITHSVVCYPGHGPLKFNTYFGKLL